MPSTRSSTAAAFVVVAALSLAGCGGSTTTASTPTATPTGSEAPSDLPTTAALVVVRTGGIAGVLDMVRVADDGTATLTSKSGKSGHCRPAAKSLERLRAIDLAAAGTASGPPQMADGFNYSVKSDSGAATVSDGDHDRRRAELVDAAAAVVATCLATQY